MGRAWSRPSTLINIKKITNKLKILLAPDKFKGSLTAAEVCEALEAGLMMDNSGHEIIKLPLADGGEGFSAAIIGPSKAKKYEITVNDPLGRWKPAPYFILENGTAIIEMSHASGLHLLGSSERNPLKTNTLGTGELIKSAIENGAKEIIIGIGGSATNDAGMGMATALGYKFLDKNGERLLANGENLKKVVEIISPKIKIWENIAIKVACDVQNPLYGINGAAYVFGPQKGASAQQVKILDEGLRNFSRVVNKHVGKTLHFIEGAGAAGGQGYGILAFLNGTLMAGIDLIIEANHFKEKINGVDLIITGEGKIDQQTLSGKVVAGVCKMAKSQNISVSAICGICEIDAIQAQELGLNKIISLTNAQNTVDQAIKNAKNLIIQNAKNLI
jgi:glycerate 2-kinase